MAELPKLHFPEGMAQFIRLSEEDGTTMVWETTRKKWLVLTPEEWVRQHCMVYLQALGYKQSQLSTEGGVRTAHKQGRSDIVAYVQARPRVLVECKAPTVKLSQETFSQAFNYNTTIGAPYIWITNGLQHFYWDVAKGAQIKALPQP